jgi:hypothetical protein
MLVAHISWHMLHDTGDLKVLWISYNHLLTNLKRPCRGVPCRALLCCSLSSGDMSPLPEVIPSDLYSFELTSDWEKDAYKQLLAAPTSTPPDSPPPLRKKKLAQQQQQQQQGSQGATSDTAAAAAAALSAFGYDESALSCFDWEDDEGAVEVPTLDQQQRQQQQQVLLPQQQVLLPQQQQQQSAAGGSSAQSGSGPAADDAAHDPAAAWEAWAAYYRSLGYDYDHTNPYLQHSPASAAAVTGDGTAAQQQQQQQQQTAPAVAAVEATAGLSDATASKDGQPQLPQHEVLCEIEEKFEGEDDSEVRDEDGWELPDEDEIDDKARLLLARLHVTQQAAAIAASVPGDTILDSKAAAAGACQAPHPPIAAASPAPAMSDPQQPRQQQLADSTLLTVPGATTQQQASDNPVCWECWSAGYTAWQQQYTAWQQQFNAWQQQYQQQQHQKWQ